MFILSSDITIGNFRFSGVNSVQVKRSIYSIADTAIITLPSIAKTVLNGKVNETGIVTGKQFSDGDPVTIKLGYNGDLQTEFKGFVKQRNLNMPLEVVCEGYSWLLRKNAGQTFWKSITVKELLKAAVSKAGAAGKITVRCEVDYELRNINTGAETAFDLINNISKYTDNSLTCFFIEPDVLWCGLVYTAAANGEDILEGGTVSYRLGYNVVKDNYLKERFTEDDPVQVRFSKKLANGDKGSQTSDVFKKINRTRNKILNHIKDAVVLKQLANEKAYKTNYSGYEGYLKAFLQPFAWPGFKAYVEDSRYPERNGTYLIEGTEVLFGIHGARRIVEVGPKIGFAK